MGGDRGCQGTLAGAGKLWCLVEERDVRCLAHTSPSPPRSGKAMELMVDADWCGWSRWRPWAVWSGAVQSRQHLAAKARAAADGAGGEVDSCQLIELLTPV